MLVEVVAVPLSAAPIRSGARFTVRAGVPLVIGPSTRARIRLVGTPSDTDLIIEVNEQECLLHTSGVPVAASINGHKLARAARHVVHAGDHLFITGGLVIRFGERPLDPREAGLERAVAAEPESEARWAVYADFLLERGAAPLPDVPDPRSLGPLAEAAESGELTIEWGPHGFLRRARLPRSAIVGTPGLFWHLEQLAHLRVARFLTHLDLDFFVGTAPSQVDRAFSTVDETVSRVLDLVGNADFAQSLRGLSLGHVAQSPVLEQAGLTFERLRQRWPHLHGEVTSLVRDGVRARLEVLEVPEAVAVVGLSVSESWQLPPQATIGSASDARLRLLGANVPALLATIHRSREGGWSIAAAGVDDMSSRATSTVKLNGTGVTRATLHPDDVIELISGLKFRFRPE